MTQAPPTPKGFRDILPELAKKRRDVINTIAKVLESEEFGFSPVETPTIEFAETLKGKYGEEEKLIYEFTDRGGRELALRYDLTVPLARFVASNLNLIQKGPFRRYQIGQVFRGEKPQAGRWREFTQFDFDSVGSDSIEEDAKVINVVAKCLDALRIKKYTIKINDRNALYKGIKTLPNTKDKEAYVAREIDKLPKTPVEVAFRNVYASTASIGTASMVTGMVNSSNELTDKKVESLLDFLQRSSPPPASKYPSLKEFLDQTQKEKPSLEEFEENFIKTEPEEIKKLKQKLEETNIDMKKIKYVEKLARGLNYYTGMIFEVEVEGYGTSVAGGGRYDDLIGMFAKRPIPAVGGSFGLDRLIEAMNQ